MGKQMKERNAPVVIPASEAHRESFPKRDSGQAGITPSSVDVYCPGEGKINRSVCIVNQERGICLAGYCPERRAI